MKVAVAVLPNGMVNTHFGRANRLALATIENGQITKWEEVDVPFAQTHGDHDHHHDHHDHHHHHDHEHHHHHAHHENIKNWLVEHGIDMVLVDHAGPGMQKVINETNIKVIVGAKGNAREVVQAVIDQGFVD
ncbi:NifB/NifX family molybdenum-iron cluster-binding protein [Tepidibacillus sp. LV47]|uniref:NifB/NifX family molybdenum-iron cluster-binding protein n=1 Tax=Tepidibacillus sp. LV47 TaxID=3398228 RepID=UPI003AAA2C20